MTERPLLLAALALAIAGCGGATPLDQTETIMTTPQDPAPDTTTTTAADETTRDTAAAATPDGDVWTGMGYTIQLPEGMTAQESVDLQEGLHELVSYALLDEDTGPISMISSVTQPSDTSVATLTRYSALLDSLNAQSAVEELSRFGLDVDGAAERAEAGEYITDGVERRLLMTVRLHDERILSVMGTCLEAHVDSCRPVLISIMDSLEVTR